VKLCRWSLTAGLLPRWTDEIKNHWNTHMKKKLVRGGFEPQFHIPLSQPNNSNTTCTSVPVAKQEILEPAKDFEYD